MRDERHFLRIALQRVEGGAIGGVQRERGEELPARLDLHAPRERRASRANPLGHLALDLRLERLERRGRGRVSRPDREGDLQLVRRSAEIARTLERGRLLDVARDEGPSRSVDGGAGVGRRARRGGVAPARGGSGFSPVVAQALSASASRRPAVRTGSAPLTSRAPRAISRWYTFRFLAKSSSVISE